MNSGYIAVLDSGIGGISVLNELIKIMPNERYLYYGDNKNVPYGNRTLNDLTFLTFKNIDLIKRYNVKALVLGCNTLSTTIFDKVYEYAGLPTFGVFPPVEFSLCTNNRTLLLATDKTANVYKNVKNLSVIGLKTLAKEIESKMFDLNSVDFYASLKNKDNVINEIADCDCQSFDTVILGCTHYCFIKNKIYDHFRPQKLLSGDVFTAKAVYEYLKKSKSLEKIKRNEVFFIGESEKINRSFFTKSGQTR